MHSKCNALESSPYHPPLTPCTVHGKIVFHETGPWCQKDWGLLVYVVTDLSFWSAFLSGKAEIFHWSWNILTLIKVGNPPYIHILLFGDIQVVKLPSFAFLSGCRVLRMSLFLRFALVLSEWDVLSGQCLCPSLLLVGFPIAPPSSSLFAYCSVFRQLLLLSRPQVPPLDSLFLKLPL